MSSAKKKSINEILEHSDLDKEKRESVYESFDRVYSVEMSTSNWAFVLEVLDREIKKDKGIIEKTHSNRSATISSLETRDKYKQLINKIEFIQSKILENAC